MLLGALIVDTLIVYILISERITSRALICRVYLVINWIELGRDGRSLKNMGAAA
jgi:hypothetical protein